MATLRGFEIDAVIIDLDGTLVDTLGDFCLALNGMLADLPWPFSDSQVEPAQVRLWVGQGSEHLIRCGLKHVLMQHGVVPADSAEPAPDLQHLALQHYQRHYANINGQQSEPFPGVVPSLQRLQAQGLRLACLTNKPTVFARELLRLKALDGFFPLLFGGDSFARKKPDPLPVQMTCQALQTLPGRTMVIGDSSNDARAARAAGCPVLLMAHGYNHGEPISAVPADAYAEGWPMLWEP